MRLKSFNFTGTGAALAIADAAADVPKMSKWFQLRNVDGTMTIGGSNVDATHGMPVDVGSAQFNPPPAQSMEFYDLENTFFYLGNGEHGVLLCAV